MEDRPDSDAELKPFELPLYTPEYKARGSRDAIVRNGHASWCDFSSSQTVASLVVVVLMVYVRRKRFAHKQALLYLPDRSPMVDFSARDRSRHLWTLNEIHAFGEVVEDRTQAMILAQEQLLLFWHRSAIQKQRVVRGFLARQRIARLRAALDQAAADIAAARAFARLCREQEHAVRAIQRAYRAHLAYLAYVDSCARCLQRSLRLFVFRCRRWQACQRIQRVFRRYRFCVYVSTHVRRLVHMLHACYQHEQLEQLSRSFRQANQQRLDRDQAQLWAQHPTQMVQLLRVRRRQRQVSNMLQLPAVVQTKRRPLHEPSSVVKRLPSKARQQQHTQSLPALW